MYFRISKRNPSVGFPFLPDVHGQSENLIEPVRKCQWNLRCNLCEKCLVFFPLSCLSFPSYFGCRQNISNDFPSKWNRCTFDRSPAHQMHIIAIIIIINNNNQYQIEWKNSSEQEFAWDDFLQTEIGIAHSHIVWELRHSVVIVWEGSNAIKRANKYRKCDWASFLFGTKEKRNKGKKNYDINKILLLSIVDWALNACMRACVCVPVFGMRHMTHTDTKNINIWIWCQIITCSRS